jgi:hypothetical protein
MNGLGGANGPNAAAARTGDAAPETRAGAMATAQAASNATGNRTEVSSRELRTVIFPRQWNEIATVRSRFGFETAWRIRLPSGA